MTPLRPKAWQALLYRIRHLALEIDDRKDVVQARSSEFLALVRREVGEPETPANEAGEAGLVLMPAGPPERGPGGPPGTEDDGEGGPLEARPPEALRKLWRAIAVLTHPDKVGSDGEAGKLYRRASSAWQDRNWSDLVGVALDMGMTLEQDGGLQGALVGVRVSHEAQLKGLEETALWQWIVAETDERRAAIVREVSAQLHNKVLPT